MTVLHPEADTVDIGRIIKLRQRIQLDQLDYQRAVAQATAGALTQSELARRLGLTQPTINDAVQRGRKSLVREGFSGASPYEIAQRFAVGEINRAEVISQLTRWNYAPYPILEGYDDLLPDVPGSFQDVEQAFRDGLIDADIYDVILEHEDALGAE